MGKGKKPQPQKLPKKLADIRQFFNFSQEEMVKYIIPGVEDAAASRAAISDYEHGRRTPSILEILQYTKAVRLLSRYKEFSMEDLADDAKNLPWQKK